MSWSYDHAIGLDVFLEEWKFGNYAEFNHPLPSGTLPKLLKLHFGTAFDQPIEKSLLPQSVTILHFKDGCFNQPIGKDVLPKLLRALYILINKLLKVYYHNH